MSIIVSINFFNTRDLAQCAAWALLQYIWKQKYSFHGGGSFLTGKFKFLLNYLCVGVVPTNSYALGEVTLWLFSWRFKRFIIIINSNVFNWILIIFLIVCRFFLNGASMSLMYNIIGSRRRSFSVWWVKFHIIFLISFVLKFWDWYRDFDNISSHVRLLFVLSAKFWNIQIPLAIMEWVIFFCQLLKFWDWDDTFEKKW